MEKHTPGPWEYSCEPYNFGDSKPTENYRFKIYTPNKSIAILPHPVSDEQEANTRLIASAPEMYALLAEINAAFYGAGTKKALMEVMAKTKPLLRKARGEA